MKKQEVFWYDAVTHRAWETQINILGVQPSSLPLLWFSGTARLRADSAEIFSTSRESCCNLKNVQPGHSRFYWAIIYCTQDVDVLWLMVPVPDLQMPLLLSWMQWFSSWSGAFCKASV